MSIRVLFVEDDATLRRVLARELAASGFEVRAVGSAEEAMREAAAWQPKVGLLDLRLPGRSGLDLLRDLREAVPGIECVVLTAHGAVPEAVEAMRLGAHDFLVKPTHLDVVTQVLTRAAEKGDLVRENARLRRAASSHERGDTGLLGRSAAMSELQAMAARIAATDSAVLITGEPGSGKELLATSPRDASARTSSTGSRPSRSRSPRCAIAPRTCPCSRRRSSRGPPNARAARCGGRPRRWPPCRGTRGRATSASWRTR